MTVSASTLEVAEGGSNTYTVVLDAQPASDVVITVSSDNTDVTVSPDTLTFTTSDWSTPKTVRVSAAQDADAVNDAAAIAHAVDAAGSADEYDGVTVAGVSVSPTDVTVAEGASAAYTVVLDAQPSGNVVITVSSGNTDVTVSSDTLTFTSSNWDTAQTVRVSASQDDDAGNDAAAISHAVDASRSADEYDRVTIAGVAVTVTDDDAGVSVSPTDVTVAEGASAAYTVVLDAQPSGNVVITVSSGNTDVTVSPATLTFTRANWSTAQTVRVSASQDDDALNDAAAISHAVDASRSADEYDAATVTGVAVTVTDGDAGASVSETPLEVADGGGFNISTWALALIGVLLNLVAIGVAIGIRRRHTSS